MCYEPGRGSGNVNLLFSSLFRFRFVLEAKQRVWNKSLSVHVSRDPRDVQLLWCCPTAAQWRSWHSSPTSHQASRDGAASERPKFWHCTSTGDSTPSSTPISSHDLLTPEARYTTARRLGNSDSLFYWPHISHQQDTTSVPGRKKAVRAGFPSATPRKVRTKKGSPTMEPAVKAAAQTAQKIFKEIHGVVVSAGKMDRTVKVQVGGRRWNSFIKKVRLLSPGFFDFGCVKLPRLSPCAICNFWPRQR